MAPVFVGNSAKIYCLNQVRDTLKRSKTEVSVLDLGCGTALPFAEMLRTYPNMRYVGVEPLKRSFLAAQRNLAGLSGTVHNVPAYGLKEKLGEQFDIVISFSTMEHVYRRAEYLASARDCLKPDGVILMNYDAGHFVAGGFRDRLKTTFGPLLARLGIENYYQSFVREAEFRRLVDSVGLKVVEAKSFNSHSLKGFQKAVPESHQQEYLDRWVDFETWLNDLPVPYDDTQARWFGTRNFILTHKGR